MKYIDAEKLIAEIERWRDKAKEKYNESTYSMGRCDALAEFRNHIVSLQHEQPDFPTTDEQMKEFLATHPKVEVPEKYKNPDWLFKKQEQQEVDLDFSMFAKEMDVVFNLPEEATKNTEQNPLNWEYAIARHFYELGLNARREDKK